MKEEVATIEVKEKDYDQEKRKGRTSMGYKYDFI